MSRFRRLALRLLNLVRAERDLAKEVSAHFHQGKEAQRDARSFGWVEDAWKGVGYAPHAAFPRCGPCAWNRSSRSGRNEPRRARAE